MEAFINRYGQHLLGTLSCFDRLIFKGYLDLSSPKFMDGWLSRQGVLLKDFARFAKKHSRCLVEWAKQWCKQEGRPYQFSARKLAKEQEVDRIMEKQPVARGLICVLSQLEPIHSFRLKYGSGRPLLHNTMRVGQVLYFYFQDEKLGRVYVRVETWLPLVVQVYANGHSMLERQLERQGIGFTAADNAFLALADLARAQKLADRHSEMNWAKLLDTLAWRCLRPLKGLLKGLEFDWYCEQVEYSTDVLWREPGRIGELFPHLLREATLSFGAQDVLHFLGRKLHPRYSQPVMVSSHGGGRLEGSRIKHYDAGNWLKMYLKAGQVLRVETVINQPRQFKILRWGTRKGERVYGWYPMGKALGNLRRYGELARAANARYLAALSQIANPLEGRRMIQEVCQRTNRCGRSVRALNPLAPTEQQLFAAVLRGEHALQGFRNHDVARALGLPRGGDKAQRRRAGARVTRLLKLLQVHELIAKVPRTRLWRTTTKGVAIMHAALHVQQQALPQTILCQAA